MPKGQCGCTAELHRVPFDRIVEQMPRVSMLMDCSEWVAIKRCSSQGGSLKFVSFVNLLDLAGICKNATRNKAAMGAEHPCGWFLYF